MIKWCKSGSDPAPGGNALQPAALVPQWQVFVLGAIREEVALLLENVSTSLLHHMVHQRNEVGGLVGWLPALCKELDDLVDELLELGRGVVRRVVKELQQAEHLVLAAFLHVGQVQ